MSVTSFTSDALLKDLCYDSTKSTLVVMHCKKKKKFNRSETVVVSIAYSTHFAAISIINYDILTNRQYNKFVGRVGSSRFMRGYIPISKAGCRREILMKVLQMRLNV